MVPMVLMLMLGLLTLLFCYGSDYGMIGGYIVSTPEYAQCIHRTILRPPRRR